MDHSVAVLYNKKLPSYSLFEKALDPVLHHWKFPFQWVNIHNKKQMSWLTQSSVILVWQPGIGGSLSETHIKCIQDALENGIGLFVGDSTFFKSKRLKDLTHLSVGQKTKHSSLQLPKKSHFITKTKGNVSAIKPEHPLSVASIKNIKKQDRVIAKAGRSAAYVLSYHGNAKLAAFLFSSNEFYQKNGFGTELDALLWRGIVFVAKKPFMQLRPPKFVTFRIEDSIGEGSYKYLDYLLKQGFKVHLGLDLNDFKFKYRKGLQKAYNKKILEFSPHAFTHYKLTPTKQTELIYVGFDGKPFKEKKLRENFKRLAKFEKKAGFKFSPVLTYHYCQIGKNAFPLLKKRGVRYLTFPFLSNAKLDHAMNKRWRRYPYGQLGLVCDEYPEDKEFFSIVSHQFPTQTSRSKKMNVDTTSKLDILFGLRLKAPGKKFEEYSEVASRARRYLRWCFENMFFANYFTHETLINYLRLSEFQRVARILKQELKKYEGVVHARYQDIAQYYECRYRTRFKKVTVRNKRLNVELMGPKGTQLDYVVYKNLRKDAIVEKKGKIKLNREHCLS